MFTAYWSWHFAVEIPDLDDRTLFLSIAFRSHHGSHIHFLINEAMRRPQFTGMLVAMKLRGELW
jgi:hypothetical protein